MGLGLEYFDVGGGLGVDYVGARSTAYVSSLNYTMDEYAADVVYTVQQICTNEGVPEPHLVSESGRALTAHHSCLLMNVFGHIEFGENGAVHEEPAPPSGTSEAANSPVPELPIEAPLVREMREIVANLSPKNSGEAYNDAVAKKEQALTMFKLGILGLEERAAVEGLFWRLCRRLVEINKKRKRVPGPTRGLDDKLADQYMANFSLFQSAPDHWAINQLFPIAPLHRHTEAPTRDSTIVDITCDSDGKIDTFIEGETVDETIALHRLRPGEPYYLGLFLTGAYQDIMGDMHNLFGRVHEVHVFVDDDDPEDYYIEEVIPGDTMERVLQRVQYEPSDLAKRIKQALDGKVREGQVKPKESVQLTDFYEQAMRGYTYLGSE
jgi:arginine decarboxylase